MLAGSVRSSVRSTTRQSAINVGTRALLSTTVTATLGIIFSSLSAADPPASLGSLLNAARAEYGCTPLQLDPVLNDVSHRITAETADFLSFSPNALTLPITGEVPLVRTARGGLLQTLREAGYNTNNARLLSGFGDDHTGGAGDNNAKAVKMVILKGEATDAFSNCSYTKYGAAAVDSDISQGAPSVPPKAFTVISVVVAGASGTP